MSKKLLIADDSTTIQKVFERAFPSEEFTLTFANDGEEALAKAGRDKPDLIIADINMPLKNGYQVCEEVKKDPVLQDTPVLLLIGILDDFDEDESGRVRADGFLVKPFEANAAINKVRGVLAKEGEAPPAEEAPPVEEALLVEEAKEEAVAPTEGVKEDEEEVMELVDIVEEPVAREPSPEEKKEEEFVLQTPLRELEAELQEKFPEGAAEEEPLTLELPANEAERQATMEGAEERDIMGEVRAAEGEKEIGEEKLETLLDESAMELEKIEGLAFKEEKKEDEVEEKRMELFEPIFEAEQEGVKEAGAVEKGLEADVTEGMERRVEKLAAALGSELRAIVEDVLKETVPKLVREEMERLRKG